MANVLEALRARRARRRAESEAKHLVAEARAILKRRREKIPDSVAAEVEAAAAATEAALREPDLPPLRQAITGLDEKMTQHLAFARKSTLREYSESISVAVGIALLLRAFVIEAFQIPSGSMIPTLEIGDHIFVSKFAYGIGIPFTNKKVMQFGAPRRGDVIVFKYPLGPEIDYIKRVIGLPGDKVEIRRNEIFINGQPVPREPSDKPYRYTEGPEGSFQRTSELWIERPGGKPHMAIYDPDRGPHDFPPREIPAGQVFVMGDNRDNSNDSRVWGNVPYELIKGRALIIWWSRGPTHGEVSLDGIAEWFRAIRWSRFFHLVQ